MGSSNQMRHAVVFFVYHWSGARNSAGNIRPYILRRNFSESILFTIGI
jgi:hypothetical protein